MRILSIETSCDETAVTVLLAEESETGTLFTIEGNALLSQIEIHQQYGGVFPALAKREHAKNIVPLLEAALSEASQLSEDTQSWTPELHEEVTQVLAREPGLTEQFISRLTEMRPPALDAIAVTAGPGLEPALWVGVNVAKALSLVWNVPLVSVNHMEGHLFASLLTERTPEKEYFLPTPTLPLLGLLISGGHTELVVSKKWLSYELVGSTRDDAVGEAFDKVARMMGLPYPGGPEISKLAALARERGGENPYILPRPMLKDPHCDFSFSGLKTAVLYAIKGKELTQTDKEDIARAFEDAATDVLLAKTVRALALTGANTLALGGGVSANKHIRKVFQAHAQEFYPSLHLAIPVPFLTSDNAVMIGLAGYFRARAGQFTYREDMVADGNRAIKGE